MRGLTDRQYLKIMHENIREVMKGVNELKSKSENHNDEWCDCCKTSVKNYGPELFNDSELDDRVDSLLKGNHDY